MPGAVERDLESGNLPARAYAVLEREYRSTPTQQLLRLWNDDIARRPSTFDSHPPALERIAMARSWPAVPQRENGSGLHDGTPVADLFGWQSGRAEPPSLTAALAEIEAMLAETPPEDQRLALADG